MTKPSSLSTCAIVTFTFVEGMSTAGDSMRFALRMRVNMSAIESVIMLRILLVATPQAAHCLPARLLHAWDQALVRHVAETNSADAELAIDRTSPAAQA